jgi:hypothetical protein
MRRGLLENGQHICLTGLQLYDQAVWTKIASNLGELLVVKCIAWVEQEKFYQQAKVDELEPCNGLVGTA